MHAIIHTEKGIKHIGTTKPIIIAQRVFSFLHTEIASASYKREIRWKLKARGNTRQQFKVICTILTSKKSFRNKETKKK